MASLSDLDSEVMSDDVVLSLKKNDICSVLDFLQEDVDRLLSVTSLPYRQLLNARRRLIEMYKGRSVTAYELYANECEAKISTGILRLDEVLDGGLPSGKIIELCGLTSSGKTQLAFTIASNVSMKAHRRVLYIDCKGDFSGSRIHDILKSNGLKEKELAFIMNRIKVVRIHYLYNLVNLLLEMKRNEKDIKSVCLVIIDTLPALVLQHMGESNKDGLGLLNNLVNLQRYLCAKHNLSFLVINLLTRWTEMNKVETEVFNDVEWTEKLTPTLGKYWQWIPYLRLISKLQRKHDCYSVEIEVKYSQSKSVKVVNLTLNSDGVK